MELEINKRIPKQIERLLKQTLPMDMTQRYMSYFMRLVSMKVTRPSISEDELVKKILKRTDINKVHRLEELFMKLRKIKSLSSRTEILYLLFTVRDADYVSLLPLESGKVAFKSGKMSVNPLSLSPKLSISKLEKELLFDLAFILEGSEGKYLKYSHLEDKYTIHSSYTLISVTKVLEEISEIACLYKKVNDFVNRETVSLAKSALFSSIRNEVNEYYRLIALIKQDQDISIKKILLWVKEPLEIMKWLCILVEACETLKGSEVISAVYSYSCQGNSAVKSLMLKILENVSRPLVSMIEMWITEGDISDPFYEFFIHADEMVPDTELWDCKFHLIPENIPYFFDPLLTNNIFIAGKTLNFLKTCCKKNYRLPSNINKPSIFNLSELKVWVNQILLNINNEVQQVLFEDYKLNEHFHFLYRFMLMGQGDFHHSLMEQMIGILGEKAGKIYKHTLRTILENAIRNSNFQYEDEEFLSSFDINLQDPSQLDIGWDVFTLDYIVNPPLSTIVSLWCSENYSRLFKFLFSVKRAEFLLNQYQFNRLLMKFDNERLERVVHELKMLRAALRYFVNGFWAYLMIECVHSGWKEFRAKLRKSESLDEIILLHHEFLDQLKEKCLVSEKEVYSTIKKIVFTSVRSQDLLATVIRLKQENPDFISISETSQLKKEVSSISKKFISDVNYLLKILETSEKPQLKTLASRLDFNDFYKANQF